MNLSNLIIKAGFAKDKDELITFIEDGKVRIEMTAFGVTVEGFDRKFLKLVNIHEENLK